MTGSTGSFGVGYSSIYAVRTNKNGDTLWTTTYRRRTGRPWFLRGDRL